MVVNEPEDGDAQQESIDLYDAYTEKADFQPRTVQEERAEAVKLLPIAAKRRISALKKLTKNYLEEDAACDREIHRMVCRMHQRLDTLYEKQEAMVSGKSRPEDEDLYEEDTAILSGEDLEETAPGIPRFWLTVLKSNCMTGELIHPYDEPILACMTRARVVYNDSDDEPGFTIEFHFACNEFFSNPVLTRKYIMKYSISDGQPFTYDGPEVERSEGCAIDWYEGKNVTCKTVKKKQKHRRGLMTRIVTRTVRVPSFFNYFAFKPRTEEDLFEDEDDAEDEDSAIGMYLKDKLIPMAVLYYTGEADDDNSIISDEDSEFETDDDGEEEDENEEETQHISVQDLITDNN